MTVFDLTTEVVLNVTTTEDQNDGSDLDGLSLRDAILIASANSEKRYTINLPTGFYNLTLQNILQPPTIDESSVDFATLVESRKTTGDLDIFGNVTIIGEDPENTIISAIGLQREFRGFQIIDEDIDVGGGFSSIANIYTVGDRVLDVASGAILTLENVTIRDGLLIESASAGVFSESADEFVSVRIGNIDTTPNGAAINVDLGANVVINNSVITNSRSEVRGGGINNSGTLELNDTIVQNNRAEDINRGLTFTIIDDEDGETIVTIPKQAGGINNVGTLTINRSSIVNNFVESATPENLEGAGAGIFNQSGATLNLINSTISGNNGGFDGGGGILNRGTANILGSTITNNKAQVGSGIYSETTGASTTLNNTIVAGNKIENQITRITRAEFARYRGDQLNPPVLPEGVDDPNLIGTIPDFVWNSIDADLNDGLQNYYVPRVFFKNDDPFSPFPPDGLEITGDIGLDNLIFNNNTGDIEYLFNSFSGSDEDQFFTPANGFESEDNNLIENITLANGEKRFAFAYERNNDTFIYLRTEFGFDEDGKVQLTLIDPTFNTDVNFDERIFVVDRLDEFDVRTFDNRVRLNDDNKRDAEDLFVRNPAQQNQVYNFGDVIIFENRIAQQFTQTLTDLPPRTDIDGFFNPSSANNLIGSSSTSSLLNGNNNNIVGSTINPIEPLLGELQNNGGSTPTHALLEGSPALNAGNNSIVNRFANLFEGIDQRGEPRIFGNRVDIGSYESNGTFPTNTGAVSSNNNNSLLNDPLFRFQNRLQPGTYLFAGEPESVNIRANYGNVFINEGKAFNVSFTLNDELITFYRFQNLDKPGTYLFATEGEKQSIEAQYDNFMLEGIAFYAYGADANKGTDIFRLQNNNQPGTYLFVTEGEKNNILANSNYNYVSEGVAFEVSL